MGDETNFGQTARVADEVKRQLRDDFKAWGILQLGQSWWVAVRAGRPTITAATAGGLRQQLTEREEGAAAWTAASFS